MTAEEKIRISKFFREEYDNMLGYVKKQVDDMASLDGEDIRKKKMKHYDEFWKSEGREAFDKFLESK